MQKTHTHIKLVLSKRKEKNPVPALSTRFPNAREIRLQVSECMRMHARTIRGGGK